MTEHEWVKVDWHTDTSYHGKAEDLKCLVISHLCYEGWLHHEPVCLQSCLSSLSSINVTWKILSMSLSYQSLQLIIDLLCSHEPDGVTCIISFSKKISILPHNMTKIRQISCLDIYKQLPLTPACRFSAFPTRQSVSVSVPFLSSVNQFSWQPNLHNHMLWLTISPLCCNL